MPQAHKQVELLCLTGHCLRHQAPSQTGRRDTMAADTLKIEHVVVAPTIPGFVPHNGSQF